MSRLTGSVGRDANRVPVTFGIDSATGLIPTPLEVNSSTGRLLVDSLSTPSGTQDTNLKQVNGVTVNIGIGTAGTGTQRVAVSSDSTISTKTALTASAPTFATVGVASAQALASNASRKGLILVNTSVNTISIGIGSSAVLNSGITLYPGGSWTMDEYTFATGAINCIASAASSNLTIQEFTV